MIVRYAALALSAALFVPSVAGAAPGDPARLVAAATAEKLDQYYVYPTLAHEASAVLRRNAEAGAYDGLREAALAQRLTADIAPVLHDKHAHVTYSADVTPTANPRGPGPSAAEIAAQATFARSLGYGVGHVAHLPGNVGYVDFRYFLGGPAETATVFDGVANAIAYSDAVVIDLRRNHGGDPDIVARFLSHFLAPRTHLNDFVGRGDADAKIVQSTYTAAVPGPRITAPLYVLTSNETFSAGEEFAYDVQVLKRGRLVGMVTGGGANPGSFHRVDDHFTVFVPDGRARNPVTQTNWEGTGVTPDVAVARERALATAYAAALDVRLLDASLAGESRTALTTLRAKVDTMTDADILAL